MPKPGIFMTDAVNLNQILYNTEHWLAVSCMVVDNQISSGGITPGKPIGIIRLSREVLEAGTPLYGDIQDRDTPFTTIGATDDAEPVGLLLHETDVTNGITNNAACLIWGFVNLNRLSSDVQSLITSDVIEGLPNITFLKG